MTKSKWRERYAVHPAADVFPMMTDAELAALGQDIKTNGLKNRIVMYVTTKPAMSGEFEMISPMLLDGRNRLEAMERAGLSTTFSECQIGIITDQDGDPAAHIIGLNIRRRHLTKQQQADLVVAAHKAAAESSRQMTKRHVKGKAGSTRDATKAAAVETAKEHGISQRTVERAFAKSEGREPGKRARSSLKAHGERINALTADCKGACAEIMTCLDEVRQNFKGDGGDKAFRGWLAGEPGLDVGGEAADVLMGLLDLDRDKWTDALSEAMLDALALTIPMRGEHSVNISRFVLPGASV